MKGLTVSHSKIDTLISVQGAYPIRITDAGVLTCDDVIKVPLGYVAKRQTVIHKRSYNVIPVVEMVIPINYLVFEIITNEGATVEPFSTLKLPDGANPYNGVRFYFVLPPGTTGIKDVIFKPKNPSMRVALQFEVLPPPYNYDNALFGVITSEVLETEQEVENLKDRVDGLNLVTNSPYFPLKQLPKGAGRQTINIENGMLYFHTIPNFLNISGDKIMNLIITLNDGVLDKSYTLALSKGSEAVLVDLVAGGIFVYLPSTGEVLKELRFNPMTSAYKTISYEGFDDILLDKLQVTISGRKIA